MPDLEQSRIRNFAIIAHIDHGKSTLADRFIQVCGGLPEREMAEQVLDSMDLERERGITIKAQSVNLSYRADDGGNYDLNLIDTPGHVDFAYEVSRSLGACEGALLVVDATQGVEAQTVANCHTAVDLGLEVIPVLNKIDLPAADPERVCGEIEDVIGIDCSGALFASARTGEGVGAILEAVVQRLPPPRGDPKAPLKALILDSWFDNFLGTVSLVRVMDGRLGVGERIRLMSTGAEYNAEQAGVFTPKRRPLKSLGSGDVGYVIAGIKKVRNARVGDTITEARRPAQQMVSGFMEVKPAVFAGLYPVNSGDFESFREALDKLSLNDASLRFEPETSQALGFGFRCGFLGMLHLEIVRERIEREYHIELIATAPTVQYQVLERGGTITMVDNPVLLPPPARIEEIREPFIKAVVLVPREYLGRVLELCMDKRGAQPIMRFYHRQVRVESELPLSEVVVDFFDRLKSASRGYASFDYEFIGYRAADMCRVDILINGDMVAPLSALVHRERSHRRARQLVERMKTLIPRQMFDVVIQGAIGSRIIARETVKALRKNVTAKCYGGDITRKRKLLEKQKEGKKRMKQIGSVDIPQEAFMAVLNTDGRGDN